MIGQERTPEMSQSNVPKQANEGADQETTNPDHYRDYKNSTGAQRPVLPSW